MALGKVYRLSLLVRLCCTVCTLCYDMQTVLLFGLDRSFQRSQPSIMNGQKMYWYDKFNFLYLSLVDIFFFRHSNLDNVHGSNPIIILHIML